MEKYIIDCGLLKLSDARKLAHWWNIRGHSVTYTLAGRGLYQCDLILRKAPDEDTQTSLLPGL